MLDTSNVFKNDVKFNSLSGTIVKSHEKSKIRLVKSNTYLALNMLSDTPCLCPYQDTYGHKHIVVLQVMIYGADSLLIEYLTEADFSGE